MDSRAIQCRMVGYGRNGYRLWLTGTKKIVNSRDVTFDETDFVYKENTERNSDPVFFEEIIRKRENEHFSKEVVENDMNLERNLRNKNDEQNTEEINELNDMNLERNLRNKNDEQNTEEVNELQNGQELPKEIKRTRTRIINQPKHLQDYVCKIMFTDENLLDMSYCFCTGDPTSYDQAVGSGEWKEAIDKEIDSLEKHGTWKPAILPKNENAIDTKWIFRTKPDGTKKARLVAKGYQENSTSNVYAPVARMPTIRMMLSKALQEDWEIRQLDIPSAFLNGKIRKEIYVKTPQGVNNDKGKVLKLMKSLYGLKGAPRDWNDTIDDFAHRNGLRRSSSDFCLYTSQGVWLLVWVDDFLVCGIPDAVSYIIEKLKIEFRAKDLGEVNNYLGMNITRTEKEIRISQSLFIDKMLRKFNMLECKGVSTPMVPDFQVDQNMDIDESIPFRQLIGSLIYVATTSRPDIIFATSFLSRFLNKPTQQLRIAGKRILRYLKHTKDLSLVYSKKKENKLTAYSDADWAGDRTDRKSVSGTLILHAGNTVMWSSRKQSAVAQSTAEAEYVACAQTAADKCISVM